MMSSALISNKDHSKSTNKQDRNSLNHQEFVKCSSCDMPYDNNRLPKLLPCNHISCSTCICPLTGNIIVCNTCNETHEYLIETNTGFLIRNKKYIKVFDEYDCIINIRGSCAITITDIVTEKCKVEMLLIIRLFETLLNGAIKMSDEVYDKQILMMEFPKYKSDQNKQNFSIKKDLLKMMKNTLKLYELTFKSKTLAMDKNERSQESIILYSTKKKYTLDFGNNLGSFISLISIIQKQIQATIPIVQQNQLNRIKLEAISVNVDPIESTDDLPTEHLGGDVFNFLKTCRWQISDGKYHSNPLLKANDPLFENGDIVDGYYKRKENECPTSRPFSGFEYCTECIKYGQESKVEMNGHIEMEIVASYFCPKLNIYLCMLHGFELKIRYGGIRLVAITLNDRLKDIIIKCKERIKNLLCLLLKIEYARKLDYKESANK